MAVPSHCIPAPAPGRQELLFMFLLSDELFVSEAYLQLLGRPADAEGYLVYTRALRKGLSRVRLLLELQRSDEARSLVARRWPQHVAPELWPRYLPKPMNGLRRSTTQELLELEGAPFVDAACGLMLGTPPPEEDRADWERRSEAAEDRRELLRLIRRRMPMLHWPWPRATAAHAPSSERYADRCPLPVPHRGARRTGWSALDGGRRPRGRPGADVGRFRPGREARVAAPLWYRSRRPSRERRHTIPKSR